MEDSGSRVMRCDELVTQVLLRLPVKSVFKFKCVSRRWNSLISDPFFRRSFESRRQQSLLPLIGFFEFKSTVPGMTGSSRIQFLSTREEEKAEGGSIRGRNIIVKLGSSSAQRKKHLGRSVAGVSEGLILCEFGPCEYDVYNPLTNQWSVLPIPNIKSANAAVGFSCERSSDTGAINYKVVRAGAEDWPRVPNTLLIETFSSETGKWKESLLSTPTGIFVWSQLGCDVVSGVFFWESSLRGFAAVYDSKSGGNYMGLIELPLTGDMGKAYVFGPSPDGGGIQYVARDDSWLKIWVLKNKLRDYRFSEIIPSTEWMIRDAVSLKSLDLINDPPSGFNSRDREFNRVPQIVGLHPSAGTSELLYLRLGEKIVCYNLRTRELREVCYYGTLRPSFVYRLLPYFQPLWPPTLPVLP